MKLSAATERNAVTEKLRMEGGVVDCLFRKFVHCRDWTKSGVEICSKEIKTQQLDWMTNEYALLIFRKNILVKEFCNYPGWLETKVDSEASG